MDALANSVRHACAEAIELRFGFGVKEMRLLVSDNGRGFAVADAPTAGHFGLTAMRERAQKIGATIVISSKPERGTSVEVTAPL
jgi:signal transduction histidine kinase